MGYKSFLVSCWCTLVFLILWFLYRHQKKDFLVAPSLWLPSFLTLTSTRHVRPTRKLLYIHPPILPRIPVCLNLWAITPYSHLSNAFGKSVYYTDYLRKELPVLGIVDQVTVIGKIFTFKSHVGWCCIVCDVIGCRFDAVRNISWMINILTHFHVLFEWTLNIKSINLAQIM